MNGQHFASPRSTRSTLARRAPRLLYLAGHFMAPPLTAGSQRPLELARRFAADGHDVTLLSTDAHLRAAGLTLSDIPPELLGGVNVVLTRSNYDNDMGFSRRKVEFIAQASKQAMIALQGDHDLVYATSTPLTVLGPALARRALRGTPFVFEVRDVWPQAPIELGALDSPWQQRLAHELADIGYRSAVHTIALSVGMRDLVVARGVDRRDITVAPNAATPQPPAPTPDPATVAADPLLSWLAPAEHKGVYAGTIGRANDVQWLVDLVDHLDPAVDLRLAVVGAGARVAQLQARLAAAPRHVRRRLRLFDQRPRGDLTAAMHLVDFAVSTFADTPALSSNSPNKVFDAWSFGVPVVINNGGWLADELATHGAGLALPRNHAAAAQELAAWLQDSAAMAHAAAQARLRCETEYNWDVVHRRIRAAITAALGG